MKTKSRICAVPALLAIIALLVGAGSFPARLHADSAINDRAALGTLKQAKAVFLLNLPTAKKTAGYLKVIEGTLARLDQQDVDSDTVIVFIGSMVQFLSAEPDSQLAFEHMDELKAIAQSIARLKERGVRMEVCHVARQVFGVDGAELLPGLEIVADGFISVIGWQAQDYKLVPVF